MKNTEPSAEKKKPVLEVLVLSQGNANSDVEKYISWHLEGKFKDGVRFVTYEMCGYPSWSQFSWNRDLWGESFEPNPQKSDAVILGPEGWIYATYICEYVSALRESNPLVPVLEILGLTPQIPHRFGFDSHLKKLREEYNFKGDMIQLGKMEDLEGYITGLLKSKSREK